MKKRISLGVNIDHVATLRQVRGGTTEYPDLYDLARKAIQAGAQQITIHLREDRRHIQLEDLIKLSKNKKIPLNLEMAATKEMHDLALKYKPSWVCIVPEKRQELTTEGGLDVYKNLSSLRPFIKKLKKKSIKVSLFINSNLKQVNAAHDLNADAVEFHTGHWVNSQGVNRNAQWMDLVEAATLAHELGMRVHAGHGLDFKSALEIKKLPYLQEVNIGHSIICYSLELGWTKTIKTMIEKLKIKKTTVN